MILNTEHNKKVYLLLRDSDNILNIIRDGCCLDERLYSWLLLSRIALASRVTLTGVVAVGCSPLLSQLPLLIYPVLQVAHHVATLFYLILWTLESSAVWWRTFLLTYSFHWKIALLSVPRVRTTVPVESPCLTDRYHHMCAAKWWLPTQCS